MHFLVIDNAISSWKSRKTEIERLGFGAVQLAEIENQVLRSIVLLMVSEYEEFIEKLFIKRASKANDPEITSFFENHMDKKFRSPNLGKINSMLGEMGTAYRQAFQNKVEIGNPALKASWDSILTTRHAIVHKENAGVINLTWQDLEDAVGKTGLVLVSAHEN